MMVKKKDVGFGNDNGLNIYSYECKTFGIYGRKIKYE